MRRQHSRHLLALALIVLAITALAACGNDDDTSASKSDASTTGSTAKDETTTSVGGEAPAAMVKVADTKQFGSILTDDEDMTLYVFLKDTGTTSACVDACATLWPPVMVSGTPSGAGVDADDLGTTQRPDGTTQLTFYGHPVYRYAPDAEPGDTTGQGVGNVWFVVGKDGEAIKSAPAGDTTTTTQKSGY